MDRTVLAGEQKCIFEWFLKHKKKFRKLCSTASMVKNDS